MGKYIHYFETEAEFNEARANNYIEPWVSYTEEGGVVAYNKTEDEKLLETPFTVQALGSGDITWKLGDKTVQYSKNGGSWETMDSSTTISVIAGDEVQFKGNNSGYSYYDTGESNYVGNNLVSTVDCNVYGNIMSLTDGDNFETANAVNDHAFYYLFCDYWEGDGFPVVNAKNLKLPATILANYCYKSMFQGCTSLTTTPELPATTLETGCYVNMFYGCTSLNYVKAMFTTTPSSTYTSKWLSGVASTGTFVKNASATWNVTGVDGIPNGWTVETATE